MGRSPFRHNDGVNQTQCTVQNNNDHSFVLGVTQQSRYDFRNIRRISKPYIFVTHNRYTAPDLCGGTYPRRCSHTNTLDSQQVLDTGLRQSREPTETRDHRLRQVDRIGTGSTGSQQNRHQLSIGQSPRPETAHPLPGTLVNLQISDP